MLENKYSTTRLLVQEQPIIENKENDSFDSVLFLPNNENRVAEGGLRTKGYFKKSIENKPLISVVTVVYNGEKYLEQTIQSVINQDYDNVEYIIIDGGSTDGTLDIIKKYENQIDYWVSESDKGLYDAMNKGIICSTGELLGFINSDDYYNNNAISSVVECKKPNNDNIVIYGDTVLLKDNKEFLRKAHSTGLKYNIYPYSLKWIWLGMIFGHPSSFISRKLYKRLGFFDVSFKISADYDLILRIYQQKNVHFINVSRIISYFRYGGISSERDSNLLKEDYIARRKQSFFMANVIKIALFIREVFIR